VAAAARYAGVMRYPDGGGLTAQERARREQVRVTGGSNKRVSLAALIAVRPGCRPRLICRVHHGRRSRGDRRKGFTEADYARLPDDAHQQPGGPLVVVRDGLNTHVSRAMADLAAARDWLTIFRLPPYAHELNPATSGLEIVSRTRRRSAASPC
jgi:hypothetical protein